MSRLLIDAKCSKKTCGMCEHKGRAINDLGNYECKIFNAILKIKSNKFNRLSFYRLKECLQAEKDYIELLMEGW